MELIKVTYENYKSNWLNDITYEIVIKNFNLKKDNEDKDEEYDIKIM